MAAYNAQNVTITPTTMPTGVDSTAYTFQMDYPSSSVTIPVTSTTLGTTTGYMWLSNTAGLEEKVEELTKQIKALLLLLGLEGHEKSFVFALAKAPADRGLILVLADWLEEQHRDEEVERLRQVGNKKDL